MLENGQTFRSPGGGFVYEVIGPVCRLYDREELPWPSCSLAWKGKQPSWNRIGRRFVGDISTLRCPSYNVIGRDRYGATWEAVVTDYPYRLDNDERRWWNSKIPPAGHPYPERP